MTVEIVVLEEAVEHLHKALALAEHHEPSQQAHIHGMLARAWDLHGDNREALNHATSALHLYRVLDQPLGEAQALNAVGWYAACLGDHDFAREQCQAALSLYRHHHDPLGEANTLDSLGYLDHLSGHHAGAVGHYQHSLELLRDLGHSYHTADTLDRLGQSLATLGRHEQAREALREALGLYRAQQRVEEMTRAQEQLDALG